MIPKSTLWYLLSFFVISCSKDTTNYTTNLPDDTTVISILTSKNWDLSSITYSQSIDINCDDNYTNSPKINRCQTNVLLQLKSDYTYSNRHAGWICMLPATEEKGSWSYNESILCIGATCYNLIQINSDGFVILKTIDSHYDCHSQTNITISTAYRYN